MRKLNLLLSAFVVAGGASLAVSTPASAADVKACSDSQVSYVQGEIYELCGSQGGTAYVICDGANISFQSVHCGQFPE